MDMGIQGRKALVTGASRGIGKAIALGLAAEGVQLMMTSRDPGRLADAVAEVRQAGGTVWFDPELSVGYRPRGSWRALAKQYFEYGQWKAVVMRMHPESGRLRQLIPVVVIGGVLGATAAAARRPVAAIVPAAYLTVPASTPGAQGWRARRRRMIAVATIHVAWAIGVMSGVPSSPLRSHR